MKGWTFVDKKAFIGCKDRSGLSAFEECPNYPENIADAWELVEEARLVIRPSFLNGKYVASRFLSVTLGGLVKSDFEVTADTAPRAICLAWIAWKESQEVAEL